MNKYLIIGLGNIGNEYVDTRHNIGFKIADALAENLNTNFSASNFGLMAQSSYKGRNIFILKPNTYMNLSGNAVRFWVNKENIALENLLIISDDLSLSFGLIRLRAKGSHAGHNGLKNIENMLNTSQYPRLRFGIGNNFDAAKQIDYVIGRWNQEEENKIKERIDISIEAIKSFIFRGISNAMNDFNNK